MSNYVKDITSNYTASYAKYVATSRAIPRLVDGLKPVQRRCINSAHDLKLFHDRKFLKVAKLEGQVMGDYHPHGGASMVILAQPFKTRYPLFEGQGNFGSPDEPNSVAASRYIETRMTKFCEDFYLSSADYADREDNYDGRLKEVVQYYPPIPGVLLSGASGIAVGLSTNIPPHKVSDVCRSLLTYLEPSVDPLEALKELSPETCEGSIILTPREEILKLYETGEGSIQYKAKTHYESIEGKLALVVDAFPPDFSKKRLETSFILDAVEAGTLELRNESSTGVRYVFLSDSKEVLSAVEERLVSSTGYRMYIEHEGKIHLYTLKEIYDDFIEARKKYIVRKYDDLISKNKLEVEFIRVLLSLKKDREYMKTIFDKSPSKVSEEIQDRYATSSEIAYRVISSSLSSMMKDNVEKLRIKYEELTNQITEYRSYIANPLFKIKMDIEKLYKEYKGEERRAIHIDEIVDSISIPYKDSTIVAHPSSLFCVATPTNEYEIIHAAELLEKDLERSYVVPLTYKYYVLYDSKGLIVVTKETLMTSNKFKSNELSGIIGTDELSELSVTYMSRNKKKSNPLGDWALRTRLSYIKHIDEGDPIEIVGQS